MLKQASRVPWFRLATMGGVSTSRDDLHNRHRPILYYGWASWHESRERLAMLQQFTQSDKSNVRVVSIAFDVQGPEFPMRYLRAAGATFDALIDVSCELSRLWDVRFLPFVFLADARGVVLRVAADLDKAFLDEVPGALKARELPLPAETASPHPNPPRFEIHCQYANNLLGRGRREDAVGELQKASALDITNDLVRPQMWAIAHPDRFYDGRIDEPWQKAQLAASRTLRSSRRSP